MASIDKQLKITIQIFGFLRRHMDAQGLPYMIETEIPPKGEVAIDIAKKIGLPPEEIEAVFLNGRVINIYDSVLSGDRGLFSVRHSWSVPRFFGHGQRRRQTFAHRAKRQGKGN